MPSEDRNSKLYSVWREWTLVDLTAVFLATVLVVLVVTVPVVRESPIRVVASFIFMLIVPGWAFVAALFPRGNLDAPPDVEPTDNGLTGGLTIIERLTLSVGSSVAILGLLGAAVSRTPFGTSTVTLLPPAAILTVVTTAIAARRRLAIPVEDRFTLPVRDWADSIDRPKKRTETLVTLVLVLSLVGALGSVGFALTTSSPTERSTNFYLLTATENGTLVADGYPSEATVGATTTIHVGIENREARGETYTVVVALQNATVSENRTQVADQRVQSQFTQSVAAGEDHIEPVTVRPQQVGDRQRLAFFLYRSDPPAEPGGETAYRSAHIWLNVTTEESG